MVICISMHITTLSFAVQAAASEAGSTRVRWNSLRLSLPLQGLSHDFHIASQNTSPELTSTSVNTQRIRRACLEVLGRNPPAFSQELILWINDKLQEL